MQVKLKNSMRSEEQERKQASFLAAGEGVESSSPACSRTPRQGVSTAPAIPKPPKPPGWKVQLSASKQSRTHSGVHY